VNIKLLNMQNTNTVLMIRPVAFAYNAETAVNNKFQFAGNMEAAQAKALHEFDAFVDKLRNNDIDVLIANDTPQPHTPDSIFPNNWISFHNEAIVLYPMYATNRRTEKKQHVLDALYAKLGKRRVVDLTGYETTNIFLEGTGSMVLDRDNKIAYACISERTHIKVLDDFCMQMGYTACTFSATDANGAEIYHTNVMMCVADKYVVICLAAVKSEKERSHVMATIQKTGKEIIPISMEQMNRFAGNMLQLQNKKGEKILVMSEQAFNALTYDEISRLEKYNRIVYSPLDTIELNGGGSARCMIAELF
jgi:hypothetical protein